MRIDFDLVFDSGLSSWMQISSAGLEHNQGFWAETTWHKCGKIEMYARKYVLFTLAKTILRLHLLLKHIKVNKYNYHYFISSGKMMYGVWLHQCVSLGAPAFVPLSPLGLAAATERVTAPSSVPAAEFTGVRAALSVTRILSFCSIQKHFVFIRDRAAIKKSEGLSIWVGLGRSAELWEGPYCIPGGGSTEGMLY